MKSMQDVIQDADKRALVVNDTAALIDSEVKRKRGLGGAAIKGGYSVVKKLKKGRMIHEVVNGLLDDFIAALEPFHATYRDSGDHTAGFGAHLSANDAAATEALLTVTDRRAEKTKHAVLRKTYLKLRPKAEANVKDALPGLGALVDKHTVA